MKGHRLLSVHASAQSTRIAVVEDDVRLRDKVLLPALREHGFVTHGAGSAAELYRHMLSLQFDIIVLNIGLPGENGLTVTRHLRSISDVGIVMLTGSSDRAHHLQALRSGADVYLTKPADLDVLAATLQGLARRLRLMPPAARDVITERASAPSRWRLEAGGWRLISPEGEAIALTSAEQCVIAILAAEDAQPVRRETLIRALNRHAQEFDSHRLEMMIHRLRRKVMAHTCEKFPLVTVRGIGYLLACDTEATSVLS